MNPNVSSETSQPKQTTLHPNLQLALSNLNVDLGEEINRFRQSQQSQPTVANPTEQADSSSSSISSSLTYTSSESSQVSETAEPIESQELQDYLACSEQLLQDLEQPNDAEPQTSNVQDSYPTQGNAWYRYLFTPLGVAGILIFLLSGTLLSLIVINLGQTRLNQSSSNSQSTANPTQPQSQQAETNPTDEASSSAIPNRPNLADDELIDLNTDNLVEAEPAEEVPSKMKPSCGSNFYCVMIENPTQTEYQRTRQLVEGIYLRTLPNVGQVLQVGAFDRQSQAEQLQQRLQQQGLSSTIYQPQN